jgi:MSHA biogenesis protein MshP
MTMMQRQGGFTLISAVFLITAILLVATVSGMLLSTRSVDTARNLEAVRAHYAARAGVEFAIAAALGADSCAPVAAASPLAIEGFSVALGCAAGVADEGGTGPYNVFTLSATASRGATEAGTLVRRSVQASVANLP